MDKIRRKNAQKVIVAMSGGLDSSVAAALLKTAGFDVVGVFMKFWMAPEKNGLVGAWNRCCSPEAESRARKVAKILKIPFYVFNFEKEFKKRIVDYFLDGYKEGTTPNPCVVCNKEIKFGLLLEKALKLDADYIVTGHYARIRKFVNSPRSRAELATGQPRSELCSTSGAQQIRYSLMTAKDKNKDQSYFLWMLNQNQLKRILFPIGDYTRKEVEGLAKKFKLNFLLNIPKSVEICFIQTTINDFLTRYLKQKPGQIIYPVRKPRPLGRLGCNVHPFFLRKGSWVQSPTLSNGVYSTPGVEYRVIGQHRGLAFYTIGQRKGIGLPGGPYYVLDKDTKKNALIVTKNEKDLFKKELIAKNVNWISGKEPKLPLKVKAKIRYRHHPAMVTLTYHLKPNTCHLVFDRPQRAITPGQSVVFYKGEELLGGGIIC